MSLPKVTVQEMPLIMYDRSRVLADWRCKRSRFHGYEAGGTGYSSEFTNLPLYLGTAVHDGLAAIARGVEIDAIASAAASQIREALSAEATVAEGEEFAEEQAALVEGLLRGFYRHSWPRLRAEYPEIVMIEEELTYNHDGLVFMSKPDLVVRDKEGCLWYVEYKTTASSKDQWANSWSTAVQLHSSIRAVEEKLGESVTGVVVQGLYKGYVAYGKQTSPFCYAYYKAGDPPFTKDEFSYSYRAGLKKFPVWRKSGGVKQWVDGMPEQLLAEQFPQVPPIFINNDLIDAFFRQRAERELEIAIAARAINGPHISPEMKEQVLDTSFPQSFESCSPSFGSGCQFKRLCFGSVSNPLEEGFSIRKPHHQPEIEKWEKEVTQ